jgi:alkylresorcinol/alkylpyrone synthase
MSGPHDHVNDDSGEFGLVSRTLGGLPIVNHILDRLGLPALLAGPLSGDDARLKLAPAVAIRLVVTNLVLGREPLYGLGEWASRHDPALLGLSSEDIGLFAVVSCTGYTAPGLDIQLARDLGMSPTLQRVVIGHMGCYAALPGLATVTDYVAARRRPALLLSAELTSLHRQPSDGDLEQVVAHALFADACAALVVEPTPSGGALEVLDVTTLTDTSTADHMTWEVTDLGFRMGLSRRVPDVVRRHVGELVASLLDGHGLTIGHVEHWAIHPGGPRIIDAVAEELVLDEAQLAASYGVLRDFGKCSSATVLLVLERLQPVAAGEYVVALTFGPGLTLCAALLRGR